MCLTDNDILSATFSKGKRDIRRFILSSFDGCERANCMYGNSDWTTVYHFVKRNKAVHFKKSKLFIPATLQVDGAPIIKKPA
jgi:hypothetical protein